MEILTEAALQKGNDIPERHFSEDYNFSKKELITLLLGAIERFRVTSNTPEGKRMMIPRKTLATYIVHGTLRFRKDERNNKLIGKVNTRINKWFKQFNAIRSGSCWVIPQKTITGLRREIGLKKEKKNNPATIEKPVKQKVKNEEKKQDPFVLNLVAHVEEVTVFRCKICQSLHQEKEELLKHFREHLLADFVGEGS